MNFKKSSNYYVSSPPDDFPNPNAISFFARQALRAGFASPEITIRRDYYRNPNPSLNFRDSIQRELEKEIIREEIIAEELFRRRLLEQEVRREMMMDREMAMRRGGGEGELRFGSPMRVQFQLREKSTPLLTDFEHRETGFCEPRMLPFQRVPIVSGRSGNVLSSCVRLKEIKEIRGPALEVDKDKGVFVAKPNASDLKRKATTPPNASLGDPSTGLKKPKSMDEWSCALCQVTATSERALNDHLQGKKHKSRESGLCSQRTGFGTVPLPKTESYSLAKPIKVPGATNSPSLKKKGEGASGSLLGKVDKSASLELPAKNQKSNHMKELETCVAKRKLGEASGPLKPANSKQKNSTPKKKFKFCCEICQVQTYRLKEMNIHKKGKRHLAKARKADKTKEISAEKSMVEEKKGSMEPDMASFLEKGVVEEEKELDISVANSLEKGVVEEEKGMYANEPNIKKQVDEVESSKEGYDSDEKAKMKVLEIEYELVGQGMIILS